MSVPSRSQEFWIAFRTTTIPRLLSPRRPAPLLSQGYEAVWRYQRVVATDGGLQRDLHSRGAHNAKHRKRRPHHAHHPGFPPLSPRSTTCHARRLTGQPALLAVQEPMRRIQQAAFLLLAFSARARGAVHFRNTHTLGRQQSGHSGRCACRSPGFNPRPRARAATRRDASCPRDSCAAL